MKKKYLLSTVILATVLLSANPNEVNPNEVNPNDANVHVEKPAPQPPKTREILKQEFENINKLIAKIDRLSEREKENRKKLEEARVNYNVAMKNFEAVLEIKNLTENMHNKQDCYVTYYRIKDLDKKIRAGGSEIDVIIYSEIKEPLQKFLDNCKNLRLDLLKKYRNQ